MILSLLVIALVSLSLLGVAAMALWAILAIMGESNVSEDSLRRVIDLLSGDFTQER